MYCLPLLLLLLPLVANLRQTFRDFPFADIGISLSTQICMNRPKSSVTISHFKLEHILVIHT